MQGKLIVFEGTDGSGKATQSRLLCEELTRRGIPFRKLEFPRYQEESSALIRLYLGGAFGDKPGDVNAYAASVFYSVDRYASYKQDWGAYYEQGGLVIADRYTTSNAVHQTGKLPPEQRDGFLDWLFDFEYRLLGLPEPTRVLYLDMPTEATEQMMRLRIDCARAGAARLIDDIHTEVMTCVADLIGCRWERSKDLWETVKNETNTPRRSGTPRRSAGRRPPSSAATVTAAVRPSATGPSSIWPV